MADREMTVGRIAFGPATKQIPDLSKLRVAPPAVRCIDWLGELLTIYDDASAAKWLTSPHEMLAGKTAFQAIRDGEGEKVARIINQLTSGAFA